MWNDPRNRLSGEGEEAEEWHFKRQTSCHYEPDSRPFVVDFTAKYWDPCIASLLNVLPQRLLDEFPIDANIPGQIQYAGGGHGRGSVHSISQGGIRGSAKAFQSVRS